MTLFREKMNIQGSYIGWNAEILEESSSHLLYKSKWGFTCLMKQETEYENFLLKHVHTKLKLNGFIAEIIGKTGEINYVCSFIFEKMQFRIQFYFSPEKVKAEIKFTYGNREYHFTKSHQKALGKEVTEVVKEIVQKTLDYFKQNPKTRVKYLTTSLEIPNEFVI
jgi:hypothetical protein